MNRALSFVVIVLFSLFQITSCSSTSSTSAGSDGSDSGSTASLTTMTALPEFDFSKYDSSSSNFTGSSSLSQTNKDVGMKVATSSGNFSMPACELQTLKNELMSAGIIAEGFLCLYKMAEENYSNLFSVPTDSFNYYRFIEINNNEQTLLIGRVGYYPSGFGSTSDAVLVIDECTSDDVRTAELRVTASTVSENLTGSGYYIRLIEDVGAEEGVEDLDEIFSLVFDTRSATWQISMEYDEQYGDDHEYGDFTFTYDTSANTNTLTGFFHDEFTTDLETDLTLDMGFNAVFGSWTEITGFSVGGTIIASIIEVEDGNQTSEDFVEGFVFNDSATLPTITLTSGSDNSDLPFYSQVIAMGDYPSPTSSAPVVAFQETWDCSIPGSSTLVDIDLTPADIAAAVTACEAGQDALDEIEDECPDLEIENE